MIRMEITVHNRYSKEVIEPFALSTIAKSFDLRYGQYYSPKDTNNFDYLSQDGAKALEITMVVPENEKQGMIYEKELAKGKHPIPDRVSRAKINEQGKLISYRGGSMSEIRRLIRLRLEEKNAKALSRMEKNAYQQVDLCICIADGSLFDLFSFQLSFDDLQKYVFDNIFFITPSYFIRYDKVNGYQEYERIIQ